jgi:predicted GNAT family acetyltransferase
MENTECFGTEPMPYEKAVKSAKAFGKEMPFVVYRGGVPVAFAMSSKSAGGYSTVSEVYTLPEHRGRGYASALVAHISRLTLEGGGENTAALYRRRKSCLQQGLPEYRFCLRGAGEKL